MYYKENLETACVSSGNQKPFQGKQETWRKKLPDFIHEKQKIHYLTPIRMVTMKNNNNRKQALAWGKDVEKLEPLYVADGNVPQNMVWQFLKKIKHRIIIWSSDSTFGCISKSNESRDLNKHYTPKFIAVLLTITKKWE